jgi:hypothetical protein
MDYPLYSPDMSPCDSDLFPKMDEDFNHEERLNMLQCYPLRQLNRTLVANRLLYLSQFWQHVRGMS